MNESSLSILRENNFRKMEDYESLEGLEKELCNLRKKKAQQKAALQTSVHSLVTEAEQSLRSLYEAKELSVKLEKKFNFVFLCVVMKLSIMYI